MIGELRIWKESVFVQPECRGKLFLVVGEEIETYDTATRRKFFRCMFEGRFVLWNPKHARQNSKKVK